MSRRATPAFTVKMVVLSLMVGIVLLPFANVVMNSLKSLEDYATNPTGWPRQLIPANYAEVLAKGGIIRATANSVLIASASVLLGLVMASLAAFALTKMKFRRSGSFRILFLLPQLLSAQVVVLPLFLIYSQLGLLNSYAGAVLIYIAHGLPIGILILTNSLQAVPNEICDAARIDGASQFKVYSLIVMPMLKTPLATVAILNGLHVWNDFFVPFMFFTKGDMATLPLSILHFVQNYSVDWPLIYADVVYMITPILIFYLLIQKYIVSGVTAGALIE